MATEKGDVWQWKAARSDVKAVNRYIDRASMVTLHFKLKTGHESDMVFNPMKY